MERPKTTWNHLKPPTTTYNHLQPPQKFQQPPQKHLQPLANYRLTVVNFFRELYKLTLNAYIYKPLFTGQLRGANDHKGLAGPTTRNRQSCENLKIYVENFLGKMRDIFGCRGFSWNFSYLKNWRSFFYRWCLESSWQMRLGWFVYFKENVVYVLLILS